MKKMKVAKQAKKVSVPVISARAFSWLEIVANLIGIDGNTINSTY